MKRTAISAWCPVLVLGIGCGQAGGSSSGDGGGAAGAPNVLGTRHDCDTMSESEFFALCDEQGGTVGDGCGNGAASCWSAGTCFAPVTPDDGEFLCDGLLGCNVGEFCLAIAPEQDGCQAHSCEDVPPSCELPLCDCILASISVINPYCTIDSDGNATVRGFH